MAAILASLGVENDRPQFEVWNKLDLLAPEYREAARARAERQDDVFAISALDGEGLEVLLARIADQLAGAMFEEEITLGFDAGRQRAWLFEQDVVIEERQTEDGFTFTVRWSGIQKAWFDAL